MKFVFTILALALPLLQLTAEDQAAVPTEATPQVSVTPEITTQSIFPDRLATAVVHFDTLVEQPFLDPIENDTCRILNVQTYEMGESEGSGKSAAIIQFQARKAGVATLPSLRFESTHKDYDTKEIQFRVADPTRTEELKLTIAPTKTTVYVGEPVRFDLTWESTLQASALQNLRLNPSFFENPDMEVAIPRNTANESKQIGLPIGGRRVIAHRERFSGDSQALGTVTLPLYLKFNKAGKVELPATRLEISRLAKPKSSFGQYAAHFNNSLFVPTEEDQRYDRLFTTSEVLSIEVLPLPQNEQSQSFSGLFTPLSISQSIKPSDTVQIGQLLELELKLTSEVPSSLLKLPPLSKQAVFDERFLVAGDYAKTWHPDGTSFKQRIRILNTSIQSIPPLSFTLFNPETAQYETLTTPSLPLTVKPYQGKTTIPLKTLNAAQALNSNAEGIWYNYPSQPMNDLIQKLLYFINTYFWALFLIIPLIAALFTPLVREARKRALNKAYKLQTETWKAFNRAPNGTEEKWQTFLAWLASHFLANKRAWTYSDTRQALKQAKAAPQDIETLEHIHTQLDRSEFANAAESPDFSYLNAIAKRIHKLLSMLILTVALGSALAPTSLQASTWDSAESSFQQAQEQNNAELYSQAALQFEATAKANQRPSTAWYNAGNAWFQAGELGHSIAAYRRAQALKPWDNNIEENLTSARSLVANEVSLQQSWWDKVPEVALKSASLLSILFLSGALLIYLRYRSPRLHKTILTLAILTVTCIGLTITKEIQKQPSGVITSSKVIGKKGPSYAYANAFDSALKDGLEFTHLETRDSWQRIQLQDKRECWIPTSQSTLID